MSDAARGSTLRLNPGIASALCSALLFGITTPVAKHLVRVGDPVLVAGLLYAGCGIGVGALLLAQRLTLKFRTGSVIGAVNLSPADIPWLAVAILAGGILAPALLMIGLRQANAAVASLLLNLELVFTALIAWLLFKEATSRRVVLGLCTILAGGLLLAWTGPRRLGTQGLPLLAIAAACLAWAVDNNLTRRIASADARLIAAIKGLTAGTTNILIAYGLGISMPPAGYVAVAMLLGFAGYGLSLVLFIVALRHLGTARTSAYFAAAPFIGAAAAILWYGQPQSGLFWLASACMAAGILLHITEYHSHEHTHEALRHTHAHAHDLHHQHSHSPGTDPAEPHTHEHDHVPERHSHPHYPDIHHRHQH